MRFETFQQWVDTQGADLARWPSAEAQAARRLLAADAQARQYLAHAQQFDAAMRDVALSVHASELLRLRLLRIPAHYPQPTRGAALPMMIDLRHWLLGGALLGGTAAALGFAAGLLGVLAPDIGLDFVDLAYGGML